MKCPHCAVEVHPAFTESRIAAGPDWWNLVGKLRWAARSMTCPACDGAVIYLDAIDGAGLVAVTPFLAYPKSTGRQKAPIVVPHLIAEDYHEACAVLFDSPKASAALSRRCLQTVLRDNGFAHHNLADAIQAVIDSRLLPPILAENIDAIRNIGNFAAHPMKDRDGGAILPVEPHEADWNLDVLEQLFDFFYVQPARAKEKRDALDAKLISAGKPPMKGVAS